MSCGEELPSNLFPIKDVNEGEVQRVWKVCSGREEYDWTSFHLQACGERSVRSD